MAGLRETKKARTRQRIADEATRLFVTRGFDAVTLTEVADAAEVSKMTVFNHFPRKEDMLFDRIPEAAGLIAAAVRERPAGTPPVEALRRLAVGLAEQRHPLSGLLDTAAPFLRTVHDSPALLTRVREIAGELEATVAVLLEEAGVARAGLVAALTVAACRTVYTTSATRILDGERTAEIVDDHLAALDAASDALAAAIHALGTGAPTAP